MKINFVTSNINKLREIEAILGIKLNQIDIDIDEIQDVDVEKVVKHKAELAFEKIKEPVLVEDTGLYIIAWEGFPGALIKWVLKSMGLEKFCRALNDFDRSAFAKTCFAYFDGKKVLVFDGVVRGMIAEKPQGDTNFGWDPVFIPQGKSKTFAQMSSEEKNKISMRKKAVEKLKKFLEKKF